MNYFIYVNWKNTVKEKFIIHHWSCGHCRMGLGKHDIEKTKQGENGVWIGPFKTKKSTMDFSKLYFSDKRISLCIHCNKK